MNYGADIRKTTVSSSSPKPKKTVSISRSNVMTVLAVIVVGILAFWGGIVYQKHNGTTTPATARTRSGIFGGGRFAGGGFGTVSAVSSTSITVMTRSGTSKTFAITSSTVITDNGASATTTSITTGETVVVIPSSTNASDASRILVNPSFGGGQFGGQSAGSGTSTSDL